MGFFSRKKEAGAPAMEASKAEAPKEASRERSYQDVGQQRAAAAREAISGGLASLKDRLGASLGWLVKKGESAMYGALAAPEMTVDAGKAIGRGAAADFRATVEDAKSVGRGIKAGAETVGAGAAFVGGKVAEGGVAVAGMTLEAAGKAGRGIKAGAEAGMAGAAFVGREVVGGAVDFGKAIGRGAAADFRATVEDAKSVGRGAVDLKNAAVLKTAEFGAKRAGEFRVAKDFVATKSKDALAAAERGMGNLKDRGQEAYRSASERVGRAVNSFNAWRNERRLTKAAELMGVDKAKLAKWAEFVNASF